MKVSMDALLATESASYPVAFTSQSTVRQLESRNHQRDLSENKLKATNSILCLYSLYDLCYTALHEFTFPLLIDIESHLYGLKQLHVPALKFLK